MVSAVYKGWRFAEDLKTSYGVDAYIEKPFRVSDVVVLLLWQFSQPVCVGCNINSIWPTSSGGASGNRRTSTS